VAAGRTDGGPATTGESVVLPSVLTVASVSLLVATLVGGSWGEWVFVLVAPLFPVLLMLLATPRRGGRRTVERAGIVLLGALLGVTAVGIRQAEASADPGWVLGVPVSTLWMGLGLVLLPLLLVGSCFAIGFAAPDPGFGRRSEGPHDARSGTD